MNRAVIVCGLPGSGKSSYAKQLAQQRKATLLDIDTVTERLVRLALSYSGHSPDDRDSAYFKRTFRMPIYETLFDIARENLPVQDAIIAGPFTREMRDPDWLTQLSRFLGCPVEVHYVRCPLQECKRRLEKRGDARDLAKLRDWDNFIKYYGDLEAPVFDFIPIDGTALEVLRE